MSRLATFLVCFALSFGGCAFQVDLDDRSCPCAEGWSCDSDLNICVRGAAQICGLPEATEPATVIIEDLQLNWSTDGSMELGWLIDEDSQDSLGHYELVVGLDEEAVRTRGEGVTIFDSSSPEHPELQWPILPESGGGIIDRMVLRDLSPDTTYFVRLVVFDLSGGAACPAVLQARTRPATGAHFVVADETEGSYFLPSCAGSVVDPAGASSGNVFIEYTATCEEISPGQSVAICGATASPAPKCYENVRLHGITPVQLSISDSEFDGGAHVRVDVALDDMDAAYFTEIGLSTPLPPGAPIGGSDYLWYAPYQTMAADGVYRTYSSPLRAMVLRCTQSQRGLDDLRVAGGEERLCESQMTVQDANRGFISARVGTLFDDGGTMRMDNVRVYF